MSTNGSKVQRFVSEFQRGLTAEDVDTHLEGCIGCGNCGNACPWHLALGAKHHPMRRANQVRRIVKGAGTRTGRLLSQLHVTTAPTDADVEGLVDDVFKCCSACGRCSLACPQGVSTRRVMLKARGALVAAGVMPPVIEEIRQNAIDHGHTYGKTYDETMGRAIRLGEERGIHIPVDVFGAEWLWGCSAIANTNVPEKIADVAYILQRAGVSFTSCSRVIDTGTEIHTTVCDSDLSQQFIERLAQEAVRLGCKGVIVGECGCDMRTFHVEAAKTFKKYGLRVAYIDAILLECVETGKIAVSKLPLRVTYHDPCWTSRLTGYVETSRRLLKHLVTEVVEMAPNGIHNYCCGGGAGQMRFWPATDTDENPRRRVARIKVAQIRKTGVGTVVTPCVTCVRSITDSTSFHGLPVKVTLVADLLLEAMEKADKESGRSEVSRTLAAAVA